MPLAPGTRIAHYEVAALIGEGGMGQVWQATDTQLNRQVALKILPDAFAADPDRLARFTREAQILASLNHPNIAAIYGIEEAEGTRALVLELVEGPTLADRISKGPIPLDEALPIAMQIAEGLEAAHEAGVIHRDLKPANFKVREDGTVKVLDFGLAKALDPSPDADPSQSPTLTAAATQMGVIMGTAAYMSPEQARGKAVDKRTDVWAYAAVVFEMLTGKKAFPGDDLTDTVAAFALVFGVVTGTMAQDPNNSTHMFLTGDIGLDPDELGPMDAGEVITQELDTDIGNEAAILGVVRIRATTEFFLRMYRDIERFETGWGVTKKISDPPVAADWEALELSEEDLDDLENCELDDCGVQLWPESLQRLGGLDWDRDDAGAMATRIIREQGHVAVSEYLSQGHEALGSYRYKNDPLSVAIEFEGLVASSPYILSYRPELHQWLHDYPNATLPGVEAFMYWSRMELGPKPIIRINHVTIYPTEEGVNGAVIIASKQLYFSHYFNVGLELNILEPDPEFPDDGFYLISLLRYRSESITGMFGGLVRRQAVGAARRSLDVYLGRVKSAVERYYAAEQVAAR